MQEDRDARAFVIVVLGYHEFAADGSHGISDICRAGVRRAEALAASVKPRAVVFTGWSSTGGASEAEQMAAAWSGRTDVELIRESHAREHGGERGADDRGAARPRRPARRARRLLDPTLPAGPLLLQPAVPSARAPGRLRVRRLAAAVGGAVATRARVDHADGRRPARRAGAACARRRRWRSRSASTSEPEPLYARPPARTTRPSCHLRRSRVPGGATCAFPCPKSSGVRPQNGPFRGLTPHMRRTRIRAELARPACGL